MKTTVLLALVVVLCTNDALSFQVKAPTLRSQTSLSSPSLTNSGIYGDVIMFGCEAEPYKPLQILVRNSSSGLYDQRDLIIDQVTQSPDLYCGIFSSFETNGKLFFVNGGLDSTLLFTLDDNYNAVNVLEVPVALSPIFILGDVRYARDTLLVEKLDFNPQTGYYEATYSSIDFINNDWKLTFLNYTIDFPTSEVIGAATDVYTQNEIASFDTINVVSFRSRQADGTWPYAVYKDVSSILLNPYEIAVSWCSIFNGHDIVAFATRGYEEVTGGMLYLFKVNGNSLSIDTSFDMLDILDDTYLSTIKPWMDSSNQPHLFWLNKDVLVTYSRWTTWADEQSQYFGIIIIISRDEDGKWKYGGSIRFPDGERMRIYDMDPTLSDLVIQASDADDNRYNYYYPRCFMDPLQQVTCQQNLNLSSCDPNNPPSIDNIYSYTDDGCGEPEVIVKDASLNNNVLSVNVRFERFGVKVGSCAATFNCPIVPVGNNGGPSSQASSASLVGLRSIVISMILGLSFALL